ncbi:MAG: CPBP family glutamic-type intramembrane protease [Acidimicrobiales bacterium]
MNEPTGSAPDPSSGWYPDPDGSARHRWWDGKEWTWQVSVGSVVEWAAPPGPPATQLQRVKLPGMAIAVTGFVVGAVIGALVQVVLRALTDLGDVAIFGISEVGLWVGFVGAVLAVSRRRGSGSLRVDYGLAGRPIDLAFGLAGSLAGRAMATAAVVPFAVFLLHKSANPDQQLYRLLLPGTGGWAVLVLVTCVGAPIVEELFFRGLVQTRLVARWGPAPGIAVTAVLFGAAHLIGWAGPESLLYAWGIAAAGLALGTVRHLTGRLGTSMVAHALFNTQAIVLLAATAVIR